MDRNHVNRLSKREVEVLTLIGQGMNSRDIAQALGIAYFTVRKHRSNILTKLGMHSSAQLDSYAGSLGQSAI